MKLEAKWKNFQQTAKSKNPKFIEPIIPFKEDVILCEYNKVYKGVYDKEQFLN